MSFLNKVSTVTSSWTETPAVRFVDKHVVAPVEGISEAAADWAKALAATAFDHAQRVLPPLALISQPGFAQAVGWGRTGQRVLQPLTDAAQINEQAHHAALKKFEEPARAARELWAAWDEDVFSNPMETRDDVRRSFRRRYQVLLAVFGRAPMLPSTAAMPAVVAGRGPIVQTGPVTIQARKGGYRVLGRDLIEPSKRSVVLNDVPATPPLASSTIKHFAGPAHLGVGSDFFSRTPGLGAFPKAVEVPPADLIPTHAGLSYGPKASGASESARHRFQDFRPSPVIQLRHASVPWHNLNYSGHGAGASYVPLPVAPALFDRVPSVYDHRWFKVAEVDGGFAIKALGNNTFYVGPDGVLRYFLNSPELHRPELFAAVGGIFNHFGARGQVPNINAVQTYALLPDSSLARPLIEELSRKSALWWGYSADDLALVREQIRRSPKAEPSVHPSMPMSQHAKAEELYGLAVGLGFAAAPFSLWGMSRPLLIEPVVLGATQAKDALALTFGRNGLNDSAAAWTISSATDPSRAFHYPMSWTHSSGALPNGLWTQMPPGMLSALDRHIPKPWVANPDLLRGFIPEGQIRTHATNALWQATHRSHRGAIDATFKNGTLRYDIKLHGDGINVHTAARSHDDVRRNMLESLLDKLASDHPDMTQVTVRLSEGDPDFWLYHQALQMGFESHRALGTTGLGESMLAAGFEPTTAMALTTKHGKPVLVARFKARDTATLSSHGTRD